jgi:hypothetical protein
VLIVAGYAAYDAELEGIAVFAQIEAINRG